MSTCPITKVGKKFFICILLCGIAVKPLHAQEEKSPEKITIEIDERIIEKKIPVYRGSLKRLMRRIEKNLKEVEEQLENKRKKEVEKLTKEKDGRTSLSPPTATP